MYNNKYENCEQITTKLNKYECRQLYLDTVKQIESNLFDAHQFIVKFSEKFNVIKNLNLPDELVLAVNPRGIYIYSLKRVFIQLIIQVLIQYFPYNMIASWGANNSIYVLVVDYNGEIVKLYFESQQVKIFLKSRQQQYNF